MEDTRSSHLNVAEMPNKMRTERCERDLTILDDWFLLSQYFQRNSVNAGQMMVP